MTIKCIGCFKLKRKEMNLGGGVEVVYECPRLPYMTTIGGLMRPGKGTREGAEKCPENPQSRCIFCDDKHIVRYGQGIVTICKAHGEDWGKWLDEHPERRAHLAPRGRAVKANWVQVFREFVETMRQEEA